MAESSQFSFTLEYRDGWFSRFDAVLTPAEKFTALMEGHVVVSLRFEGMGRPRIDIQLPDRPFTTHTLEERYPHLSHTLIHKRVKEWLSGGKVKCIGKQPQEIAWQKAWFLYEPVGISRVPETGAQRVMAAGRN